MRVLLVRVRADLEGGAPACHLDDGAGKAGLRQPIQGAFHRCVVAPIGGVRTWPVAEGAIAIRHGGGAAVKGHIDQEAVTIDIGHPVQTARRTIAIFGKGSRITVGVEHIVGAVGIGVGVSGVQTSQVQAEIDPALFDIVDHIDAVDNFAKVIFVYSDGEALEIQTITAIDRQGHQVIDGDNWFVPGLGRATGAHGFVA